MTKINGNTIQNNLRTEILSKVSKTLENNNSIDFGYAVGVQNSFIKTGNGNDKFNLISDGVNNSIGLLNTRLNTGSGNDLIKITGDIYRSEIYADSGNDRIILNGRGERSKVYGGSGND